MIYFQKLLNLSLRLSNTSSCSLDDNGAIYNENINPQTAKTNNIKSIPIIILSSNIYLKFIINTSC